VNDSFCAISSGHVAPVRRTSANADNRLPRMPASLPQRTNQGGSRSPAHDAPYTDENLMLNKSEPDWNIDDLTDAESTQRFVISGAETSAEEQNTKSRMTITAS